ncbi:MAG: glycosyltransferase family 39 protein [bacterium]|nr:glycosyltransferase family 39 protein [bacterium]
MFSFVWNLLVSADSILISFAITILATYYGWQILKLLNRKTNSSSLPNQPTFNLENLIFSTGLGFGLFSLFVLSLGLCNLLYFRLIVLLLLLLTLPVIYSLVRKARTLIRALSQPKLLTLRASYFWSLLFLFIVLIQLNIAVIPPFEYDALEYHFGAPDYYLQHHKITAVPGNVYAHFPANTEMLYTLGMLLHDDVTGKLFHFYLGILAAMGLFVLGKKWWSETVGMVAAVIFFAFPLVFQVNLQANIDLSLAGFATLMLLAFFNWLRDENPVDLIRSSIFLGFGLGCKYTAVLTMAIPLFLAFLWHNIVVQKDRTKSILLAWYLVVSAFLLTLPWLIKNYIFTSNPIFPLFYNLFGGYTWTPELATKFMNAHLSFNYLKPFYQDFSRITILTVLVLLVTWKKDTKLRYLLIYILSGYIFWFFLTEHIERFLMPILPAVALGLIIVIYNHIKHEYIKYILSGFTVLVILFIGLKFLPALPPSGLPKSEWRRQILNGLSIYPAMEYINTNLPATATVLFIGEARRHHLTRSAILNTVFDRCLIEDLVKSAQSPDEIYFGLREMKVTHVLFNPYEVARLTKFYGPYFTWENAEQYKRFSTFCDQYLRVEWSWYAIILYRLKP